MNRDVFDLASTKLRETKREAKRLYQALGAYLRPYRERFILQTRSGRVELTKPVDWLQYIISVRVSWRKTFLTSI
jgi:hypothetical protein